MGTQKIEMGRNRDTDYEMKKRAALAQSRKNDFMQGVQVVENEGVGKKVKNSRDPRGIPSEMPNELVQGRGSDYLAKDEPGNAPLATFTGVTGLADLGVSSTQNPQTDPERLGTDALEKRMQTMAKGGMHNLNSVPNLYPRRA